MLSFVFGLTLLVSSGFLVPQMAAPEELESASITYFWHIIGLWCALGACVMIEAWSEVFYEEGVPMISEDVHRQNYGIGVCAMIVFAALENASFWWINYCFWPGYTFYIILQILMFLIIRFLLFPGITTYRLQNRNPIEYVFFITLFAGLNTEIQYPFMFSNEIWSIHVFYNFAVGVCLVELHALVFNPFTNLNDVVDV